MSDYNYRQFRLMQERVGQFENKTIGLKRLIAELDALLSVLEEPNKDWKTAFQRQWGRLEDTYAVALDRGNELTSEDWALIEKAIQEMKRLLEQAVSETGSQEE